MYTWEIVVSLADRFKIKYDTIIYDQFQLNIRILKQSRLIE